MHYIIQENLFKEFHYKTLVEYLERYGLTYETIPFRPFTDELHFKTDRKDVFFFGSVNGAQVAKKYDWNPGCLYNENHDFEVYAPHWWNDMLNKDGYIIEAGDKLPEKLPYVFFARPTKDTKVFSGQCFSGGSWEEYIHELKQGGTLGHLTSETKILVAPIKDGIQQEIRCWVVDGKIATMSQYKIGKRVVYQNQDNNEEVTIFVNKLIKKFQPAKAFVVDICLYQDEYYVVEVNCINCSGFYDGDMSKLIQGLEKTFGNEKETH